MVFAVMCNISFSLVLLIVIVHYCVQLPIKLGYLSLTSRCVAQFLQENLELMVLSWPVYKGEKYIHCTSSESS